MSVERPVEGTTPEGAVPSTDFDVHRQGRVVAYLHRHPAAGDLLFILAYLLLGAPHARAGLGRGDFLPLVILIVTGVALAFRRRAPVAVLVLVGVAGLADALATSSVGDPAGSWFALYTVALVRSPRFAVAAAVAASLPMFVLRSADLPGELAEGINSGRLPPYGGLIAATMFFLANLVATGIGVTVRRSRQRTRELHQWAADTALLARTSERNRIAREVHDVVAHSLTVVIALSDGATTLLRTDPGQAETVLHELSTVGRAALTDMRRILGVLKDPEQEPGTAPRTPVPDPSSLRPLLEGFRTAGLPLQYTLSGPPLPPDQAFRLTVYRILQESLTNTLRYALHPSRVEVTIASTPEQVTITVTDDGAADPRRPASYGSGRGITGMRERAALYGGTLTCGPQPDGGFIVRATLTIPKATR